MPYNAANAVAFAQRQSGRYRDGQCWTLVEDALTGAGGKSSIPQTPNFGPRAAYVWGTVVQISALQVGDVLQFSNYRWTRTTRVDVTESDGSTSFQVDVRNEGRGGPQHTAIVSGIVSTGVVEVVEQNIPDGSGPVQQLQLVLRATAPTSERIEEDGRVTVTTTTHTIVNPPTCYRPVNA